jgi:hypothetical protein
MQELKQDDYLGSFDSVLELVDIMNLFDVVLKDLSITDENNFTKKIIHKIYFSNILVVEDYLKLADVLPMLIKSILSIMSIKESDFKKTIKEKGIEFRCLILPLLCDIRKSYFNIK